MRRTLSLMVHHVSHTTPLRHMFCIQSDSWCRFLQASAKEGDTRVANYPSGAKGAQQQTEQCADGPHVQ